MFCGETVIKFAKRVEVWADSGAATMGATEGTLQRASQPSIIMQPDSAMPMGPSRIHSTRIVSVATRQRLIRCEYPVGNFESQVLGRKGSQYQDDGPKRPPAPSTGGLPACRPSRLRELTGLDQVNEHVPLVLGENREIPGFTDPDLVSRELHFRASAAAEGTQQHFLVVQCLHLLPFTIFSRSM